MNLLGWDRTPIARRADNFADRATPSGEFVRPVERLAKGILLSQHATAINQCHSAETIHLDGGYGPTALIPPDLGGSLPWGVSDCFQVVPTDRGSTIFSKLALLPRDMPFAQAALLGCGVVAGAGAVLNTADVRAGDTVVIFGAGGVGLNAISGACIAGASRIVVIDIQPNRLQAAQRFGATDIINSTKSEPVEAVRGLLPRGADHVFDFVGLKAVAEQGLSMLGVGGGLYLVGVSKPEVGLDVNIFDAIGGQKRVQGVNFGSTNFKHDIPMYADLYLQGPLNLDDLVSIRIALLDVNDGYAALKDGSILRSNGQKCIGTELHESSRS